MRAIATDNRVKYRAIVKISMDKDPVTGKDQCAKWTVTDLVSFTKFLDKKYPHNLADRKQGWQWMNVYEYVKDGNGKQLACFTKDRKPTTKNL